MEPALPEPTIFCGERVETAAADGAGLSTAACLGAADSPRSRKKADASTMPLVSPRAKPLRALDPITFVGMVILPIRCCLPAWRLRAAQYGCTEVSLRVLRSVNGDRAGEQ
jgi:hypothetical protein